VLGEGIGRVDSVPHTAAFGNAAFATASAESTATPPSAVSVAARRMAARAACVGRRDLVSRVSCIS